MARWIDDIIKAVQAHPYISDTHKRILISRIEQHPTQEEINKASAELKAIHE